MLLNATFTMVKTIRGNIEMSEPFIKFGELELAPQAWAAFAVDNPNEALPSNGVPLIYSTSMFRAITRINSVVNSFIDYKPNDGTAMEPWRILSVDVVPRACGDCHDYALTKRHLLMKEGSPACVLLMALVVAKEAPNIRHCVLVVRTDQGDFVCDSLVPGPPVLWHVRNFEWILIQSPNDPNRWCKVVS